MRDKIERERERERGRWWWRRQRNGVQTRSYSCTFYCTWFNSIFHPLLLWWRRKVMVVEV